MTEGTGEFSTSPKNPPRRIDSISGDRARELTGIQPKKGFFGRWLGKLAGSDKAVGAALVTGAAAITGVTAANELGVNPAAPIVDSAAAATANLKAAGHDSYKAVEGWVNEDSEIDKQNQHLQNVISGIEQPHEGEELINQPFKLVPAGATLEERQEMIENNTPINIRNVAGTYTETGQMSHIIDKVPQGATAERVVRIKGTAPNSTEEADWYFAAWTFKNSEGETITITGQAFGIYTEPVNKDPKYW